MWISLVLIFCLALGVQSSVVKEFQDEVPGHEGQCMSKGGKFYKLGETMNDDQEPCTRKVCKGSAQPGSVYIEVQSENGGKSAAAFAIKENNICIGWGSVQKFYCSVDKIQYLKCSKIEKSPGCELKSDPNQSFPNCCARLECKHH